MKYFTDSFGHIWSIDDSGKSNYPDEIELIDDASTVKVTVSSDTKNYPVWNSLTRLALHLEQQPDSFSQEDGINLDYAVAESFQKVMQFHDYWVSSNKKEPEHFPLFIKSGNDGIWFEQLTDYILN